MSLKETESPILSTETEPAIRLPDRQRIAALNLIIIPIAIACIGNVVYLTLGRGLFQYVKEVYFFNSILLPILMLVLGIAALAQGPRTRDWKMAAIVNFTGAATILAMRFWCSEIEPHWLAVREHTLAISKPAAPLRILHLSDTQSPAVGRYEERTFRKIAELKPDLILVTGDYLQPLKKYSWESEAPKLAALFATVHPPLGIYGVGGDVDGDLRPLSKGGSGLSILEDQAVEIPWHGARIRLMGLSCSNSRFPDQEPVRQWLEQGRPDDFNVLIGHAPDYIRKLKDLPIDLCLAGHTHGGQVRVPFYGPPITLSSVPREWALGLHHIGNTWLNVSGGAGSEHINGIPAIRFNCPTEMSLVEIKK